MSRVAEAIRRSRESSRGESRGLSVLPDRAGSDEARTSTPWDFTESPHQPSATDPATGTTTTLPRPSLIRAASISQTELTVLVKRIFEPPTGARAVRSVLFFAVGPQVNSGPLCAATGQALAERVSQPVCLVDGKLRRPTLHAEFGLTSPRGLSEALLDSGADSGIGSFLTKVGSHLWLLPAGSRCADALPQLAAEQFRARLLQLLAGFHYVLVDACPAASTSGDAVVLGSLVDGVVLLVEANGTRREAARRAVDELRASGVRVLGAVLTNRTFPIPEAIYRTL